MEMEKLQGFILKRGWKLKIAKKTPIEQSLFIHGINELGAIQNYLQTCAHPFNESEIVKLYIASITHDCEKETEEWQEKIRLGEKPPHHSSPEYARKFVNELIDFLNREKVEVDLDQHDINDVISAQALHMSAAAKNPRIVFDELIRKHKSERWSEIAHLVDLFDDIVSLESVESSVELLSRNEYKMFSERLEFKYHKISHVRGILTSLLHKACEKAHEKHSFVPFLYYPDGTLYFRVRKEKTSEDNLYKEICVEFKNVVEEFLEKIDLISEVSATIGRADRKLLLLPEFLTKNKLKRYFTILKAKGRSPTSDENVIKYIIYKGILNKYNSTETAAKALKKPISEKKKFVNSIIHDDKIREELVPNFERYFEENKELIKAKIHDSKPQQYMFQLFKEIVKDNLYNEAKFVESVKKDFDEAFGTGFFENVMAKSTSMPYIDFADLVEPYWCLNPKNFLVAEEKHKIQYLPKDEQENILIETLSKILINNIDECSRLPKDIFFAKISELLVGSDLVYPIPLEQDIIKIAREQLNVVGESKENIFGEHKGRRLCPVCNKLMPEKNLLRADLLSDDAGTEVFNNKGVAGTFVKGGVNICLLCYGELILRRVILGSTPSDLILLFPSLNFTRIQASNVMELMKDIDNKLGKFYTYHNPNLNERIRFQDFRSLKVLASQIFEKKAEEISAELSPDKFIELFRFKIGEKEKKNDLSKIETLLKNDWNSVDAFNNEFSTKYETFQEIAEDIFEKKCPIPELARNDIIVMANVNATHYSIIYETPNFIVISLSFTFKYDDDEAEVNIILKRLLFAFYMFLLTDCAVMIIPGKEVIHIPETRKMVYVQPNSTLKQVIKEDWVSILDIEKWIIAISAAVKLAKEGNYSNRSGIFEVLIQPTAGHILGRITSQKTQSGSPKRADSRLINMVDKLLTTGVLKNETIINIKI